MRIVCLDAFTANPGDLSWSGFEALGDCVWYDRTTPDQILERAQGATVLLTNKVPLSRQSLGALPDLRYIGVLATGHNVVDSAAAKERGIPVTNVPGYSTASVAQLVFALLLELSNHVGAHSDEVRKGRWAQSADFCFIDHPIHELAGRTLGIYGYGEIGAAVAKIGLALGMEVIAHRRSWSQPPLPGVAPASAEDLWTQSDVLSLHCPLTPETQHLVNAQTLSQMKSTAWLINTARGPLIDESALAAALNEGRIAGAGLDVLSQEPPQAGNPLFTAKNCIITPHQAWASQAARQRLIAIASANVEAWLAGSPKKAVNL
jgi:glycerate dehydrogenase